MLSYSEWAANNGGEAGGAPEIAPVQTPAKENLPHFAGGDDNALDASGLIKKRLNQMMDEVEKKKKISQHDQIKIIKQVINDLLPYMVSKTSVAKPI